VAELAHALLLAVGAPWAEPTRARLTAILAGVSAGSTGEFAAVRTGTFLAAPTSGPMRLATPSLVAPTSQSLDGASAPAVRRRSNAGVLVGVVAIGLAVAAVLAIRPAIFFGGKPQPSADPSAAAGPSTTPPTASASPSTSPPSTSVTAPIATPTTTASIAPTASASATATSAPKPVWRPTARPDPTAAKPPPTSKPTSNPLDDRM
jgi:hypothetical protein